MAWIPRPNLPILLLLLGAAIETAALGWVQWQNYLSHVPTQADLGDYNQALYTTVHGQGFFYYTTNVPGGSNGTLWGVHFAPTLFLLLPFYAVAAGPVTLLLLKQLALALGAIPLYAIARIYFRTDRIPFLLGALYLVSPIVLTTDWNSFDLEPLFPLALLCSLYFLSKGRYWPFLASWCIALGTLEVTAPFMALFAVGGLAATYLSPPLSPYWNVVRQRRVLLTALLISVVWLVVAFETLTLVSARGGTFGNAYAIRYSVLGANSLPDVIPRALTHPGAAGSALQYDGGLKVLFLGLLLVSTGVVWLLSGLRTLLPVGGYLTLALLSNNHAAYTLGTEQPALLLGFLFVGTVEGAIVLTDWIESRPAGSRRNELLQRLTDRARQLADAARTSGESGDPPASRVARLKQALQELRAGDLGSGERRLKLLGRELGVPNDALPWIGVWRVRPPRVVPGVPPRSSPPRSLDAADRRILARLLVVTILVVSIVPSAIATSPLSTSGLGHSPSVKFALSPPDSHDAVLDRMLGLIPPNASVLTTSHLFPQLCNRPNAFVVPNQGAPPSYWTIGNELNFWANQSSYIAIDYRADAMNAEILRNETNLSAFGLFAANDGTVIYQRGWTGPPVYWMPFTLSLAGGNMSAKPGVAEVTSSFSSPLGPALYHPPGGAKNLIIWTGPSAAYLPRGSYEVMFHFYLTTNSSGPQVLLRAMGTPGFVSDPSVLDLGDRQYRIATVIPSGAPSVILAHTSVSASGPLNAPTPMAANMTFQVQTTEFVSFPGIELSTSMGIYLVSVQLVQLSSFV